MRHKVQSTRSLKFVKQANTINFAASLFFLQKPSVELSIAERKFCKENAVVPKTLSEMKLVHSKKGKAGLKQFMRNRRMTASKVTLLMEYFKETEK